jgi:ABC-type Fe3+-hydroxamate transport system substrate-binding protein
MSLLFNRRQFGFGASALLLGAGLAGPAAAQDATRTVTTLLGTYDIPLQPRRVVAIDPRTDYEPAVLFGLPVVGYGRSKFWDGRDFAPVTPGATVIEVPLSAEVVLKLEPDLIICSGEDPDGEWWPARAMQQIAPVLTTTFTRPWKTDLLELGGWLERLDIANRAVGEYDAAVAAMKAKYAAVLERQKLAVITYSTEYRTFTAFAPGSEYSDPKAEIITELGMKTIDRALLSDDSFSMENLTATLGDVDAIMFCNLGDGGVADLAEDPLWTRLPAVGGGRVYESKGYSWYGSYYTAMNALEKFEGFLAMAAQG